MLGISPQKGVVYYFPVKLLKENLSGFRTAPVVVAGDIKVEFFDVSDGFVQRTSKVFNIESNAGGDAQGSGTFADHVLLADDTDTDGSTVILYLNANQMNHDMIVITASDVDGANDWTDNSWVIYPDSRQTTVSNITSILADTNELQSDDIPGALAAIDVLIDAIKAVTDVIPDSGALTSLAQASALATVDTEVGLIQTDLDNATDGLGALKTLIDTVNTDLGNSTDGLGALKTLLDTINSKSTAIKNFTAAKM